jgi:hypothetical protein
VLAVARDSAVTTVAELTGRDCRVSTEYPELTRRLLEKQGVQAEIRLSYGATEAKIPDIADAVVEITETGRALAAAGLRIVGTLFESCTELIANPTAAADPVKRHAMDQLLTLLQGTLEARGKVLLKLNVAGDPNSTPSSNVLPVAESAHRVGAVGGRGIRGRDGGAQVGRERAHPGAQGQGGHRHHRAPAVEDRPLRARTTCPRPRPAIRRHRGGGRVRRSPGARDGAR